MSRRSMKEKKNRRLLRQAAAGDGVALERVALRAPHAAIATCIAALAKGQASALPAARRLAKGLRREGRTNEVVRLAHANGRRDPALTLEAALALFSDGDDSGARELVRGHAELERLISPLLRAGSVPAGAEAARALAPTEEQAAAFAVAAALATSSAGATTPERAEASVAALLASTPGSARDGMIRAIAGEIALQPDAERAHLARALANACATQTLGAETTAELARLLASVAPERVDPLACAPEDAAHALLARGFARLGDDPKSARDDFDRAAALGAELSEALRGRFLAAVAAWDRASREASRGRMLDSARDLMSSADRLNAAMGRSMNGTDLGFAELAVALGVVGCLARRSLTEPAVAEMARRWLDAAKNRADRLERAGATLLARTREDLDLSEGHILLPSNPRGALAAAERLLARDPASRVAWMLAVAAARTSGDSRLDDLLVQAWRATGADEFAAAARSRLRRRGELAPFAELEHPTGRVLAFECVEVLAERTVAGAPTPEALIALAEEAEPARLRLAPEEQELVDATLLALAAGSEEATYLSIERLAAAWSSDSERLPRLLSVAVVAGDDAALARTARALVPEPELAPAFVATMRALRAVDRGQAEQLARDLAPELSEAALGELRAAFDRPRSLDEALFDEAFGDLHGRLHPEVCLDQLLQSMPDSFTNEDDDNLDDGFDDVYDGDFGDDVDVPGDAVGVRLRPVSAPLPLMRRPSQAERNRKKRERRARGAS